MARRVRVASGTQRGEHARAKVATARPLIELESGLPGGAPRRLRVASGTQRGKHARANKQQEGKRDTERETALAARKVVGSVEGLSDGFQEADV